MSFQWKYDIHLISVPYSRLVYSLCTLKNKNGQDIPSHEFVYIQKHVHSVKMMYLILVLEVVLKTSYLNLFSLCVQEKCD